MQVSRNVNTRRLHSPQTWANSPIPPYPHGMMTNTRSPPDTGRFPRDDAARIGIPRRVPHDARTQACACVIRTPCQTGFVTFSRWFYVALPGGRQGGAWRPPGLIKQRVISKMGSEPRMNSSVALASLAVNAATHDSPLYTLGPVLHPIPQPLGITSKNCLVMNTQFHQTPR